MRKPGLIFATIFAVAFITIACNVLSTPVAIPPSPQPPTQSDLFKLLKTVQITPDDRFPAGIH